MSDLDVIREARDYLAGLIEGAVPGPWEIDGDGILWWRDPANPGFSLCAGRSTSGSGARLIVALRAAAPHIVGALDSWLDRIADFRDAVEPIIETHDATFKAPTEALALARAILATKGQDHD